MDTKTAEERKFYSSKAWTRTSLLHRQVEPFCRQCGKYEEGQMMTDHIVPLRQGGARFDESNLQTLCNSCHNSKRQSER